jgi:hypothetical protein
LAHTPFAKEGGDLVDTEVRAATEGQG